MKAKEKNTSCNDFNESLASLSLLSGISSIIDIAGCSFLPHVTIRHTKSNYTLLNSDMTRIGKDFNEAIKRNVDLKELSL